MSGAGDRAQLVRQLAEQGWSEAAIAAALQVSLEQVALALRTAPEQQRDERFFTTTRAIRPPLKRDQVSASGPVTTTRASAAGMSLGEFHDGGPAWSARTAEQIGRATLERLAKHSAEQRATGEALRAEIERLAQSDRGSGNRKRGRAKRILRQLTRPVALRTVQWHLAAIARTAATTRE